MTATLVHSDNESGLAAMQGGMSNPVRQTQALFRTLMEAMARPGRLFPASSDARPPSPLCPLAAAILVTLADADTPLWLDGALANEAAVTDWLTFHVSAPFASETASARFAVLAEPKQALPLEVFGLGSQDYPDMSTTLILQVERLTPEGAWQLTGPGIKERHTLGVEGLSPRFFAQWEANRRLYPRGVDVMLVAPDAIACLPRTTMITEFDPKSIKTAREQ